MPIFLKTWRAFHCVSNLLSGWQRGQVYTVETFSPEHSSYLSQMDVSRLHTLISGSLNLPLLILHICVLPNILLGLVLMFSQI